MSCQGDTQPSAAQYAYASAHLTIILFNNHSTIRCQK
jgi:hypothetical protein